MPEDDLDGFSDDDELCLDAHCLALALERRLLESLEMDRPAGPQFRLDGGQRGGSMTIGARSRGASPVVCASQQLVGKGGDSAVNSRQRPRHLALPEHRARFGLTAEPQARAVVVFDATEVALVGFESRGARGVTVTVARAVGTLGRVGRYAILPLGRCGDGLQRQQRQRGALHYGAIWIYLQPRGQWSARVHFAVPRRCE
jgi:hypothetical protein